MVDIIEFDYEMKKHGDTKETIAGHLGISTMCLRNKLSGSSEFKVSEIVKILNLWNINLSRLSEIFFDNRVDSQETYKNAPPSKLNDCS